MRKTLVLLLVVAAAVSAAFLGPWLPRVHAYPAGWTLQQEVCGSGATECDVDSFDNYVYVVWRASSNNIYFRRSTDYGVTWDAPLVVAPNTVENEGPVVIRGASAGFVYVLCTRKPSSSTYRTYIYKSENNGQSFSQIYESNGTSNRRYLDACRMPGTNEIIYVYSDDIDGVYEVHWGIITVNGTVSPQANDATWPDADGIAGTYPTVAAEGTFNILVAWQEAQGGGHTHTHLRCNMSTDRGQTWGATYSGHIPDNDDEAAYIQRQPVAFWDTNPGGVPGVVYSCENSGAPGTYFAGRYRIGTGGWDPDNTAGSNRENTGAYMPYSAACGSETTDVFCRNSSGFLHLDGVASNFLGAETIYNGANCIAAAHSNEGIDYCAAVTSGGKVYARRTDTRAPDTLNITAPDYSDGNTYRNANFLVECAGASDDFNVTGTDLVGPTQYDNGLEKTTYLFTINGADWFDLPCVEGSNMAVDPPWARTIDTTGFDQVRMLLRATATDSAGNNFTYDAPAYTYIDKQAPQSSLDVAGTLGDNGIYRSNVQVTIISDDYTPDYSEYKLENLDTGQVDSNWTRQVGPFPLTEGHWKVHYRSADKAGNVEATKFGAITVDKTGPVCSVTRPSKDTIQTGYYSDDTFRITGTGTDPNGLSWSAIYVDGAKKYETASAFNMSWTWDLEGVPEGNHTIQVKARDSAGNNGSTSKTVFVGNVAKDWYFAEGNTLPEFDEWLSVLNPGDQPCRYQITFMLENGETRVFERLMNPHQRDTVRVKDYIEEGHTGVSIKLHSDSQAIVAERPMYFVYKYGVAGYNWKGGHDVVGVNVPQKQWYFAEGTTRLGDADGNAFEEWLLLQNPSDTQTANVAITYMLGSGQNVLRSYQVAPHSRRTVEVAGDVGINQDVSAAVSSDVAIMAERAMYFNYHGFAVDGSNVVGATGASTSWDFAEGCTQPGYQEWITIQNPNQVPAECTINYMTGEGETHLVKKTVAPMSRYTVDVLGDVGGNQDVAASLSSDVPVIAERPMYFIYGMDSGKYWNGGESAVGNPGPSTEYFIAEGTTISEFDTYYTLMNPDGSKTCKVDVDYMFADGTTQTAEYWIEPHSRITINVRSAINRNADVSGSISAGFPIVIERPMYFNYRETITGGHDACGYGVD
ncbi:MAG: hypothetical protein KKF41_10275 [Actinobacteria bacterium]|nr:hypothetical protein [Actinomycetota bacterium]MBU1943094.1 hypothetical protein [Actinomycetota bacterium]MBU2687959.1 hypothetical protein [Actinomycetota bacterium]